MSSAQTNMNNTNTQVSTAVELQTQVSAPNVWTNRRLANAKVAVPEPQVAVPEPQVAVPEPQVAVPEPQVAVSEPEVSVNDDANFVPVSRKTEFGIGKAKAKKQNLGQYTSRPKVAGDTFLPHRTLSSSTPVNQVSEVRATKSNNFVPRSTRPSYQKHHDFVEGDIILPPRILVVAPKQRDAYSRAIEDAAKKQVEMCLCEVIADRDNIQVGIDREVNYRKTVTIYDPKYGNDITVLVDGKEFVFQSDRFLRDRQRFQPMLYERLEGLFFPGWFSIYPGRGKFEGTFNLKITGYDPRPVRE